MKRRYSYTLLFTLPALLISVVLGYPLNFLLNVLLWLFVYGDTGGPQWVEYVIAVSPIAIPATLWLALLWAAYLVGKRKDRTAGQ